MICGVVVTIISGCDMCTACRVVCDCSRTLHGTQCSLKYCCHNAAYHITMYFYWSIPQIVALARLSIGSLRMV